MCVYVYVYVCVSLCTYKIIKPPLFNTLFSFIPSYLKLKVEIMHIFNYYFKVLKS